MDPVVLIVIVVIAALLFDFTNGWNDSANAIATVVSTRVMSPTGAVLWSAMLNFVGTLTSTKVAKAIAGDVINLPVNLESERVVLAAMISASAWVAWCTRLGLPISASHSLIGGMMGAAVGALGFSVLKMKGVTKILIALVASPLLGMLVGFLLLTLLYTAAVAFRSNRVRVYVGLIVLALLGAAAAVLTALHLNGTMQWEVTAAWLTKASKSTFVWFVLPVTLLAFILLYTHKGMTQASAKRWFGFLQICSSSLMAYEHGKNDAQKVMGVITLALFVGGFLEGANGQPITKIDEVYVPLWVMISCGAVIALGTAIGGRNVIKTLGMKLAHITPAEGFAAETAGGIVLESAASMGVPVSTTHTITGSILGVGTAKNVSAVKWGLGAKIVYAWIFTLPVCFAMGTIFSIIAQKFGAVTLVTVTVAITAFLVARDMVMKRWECLLQAGRN